MKRIGRKELLKLSAMALACLVAIWFLGSNVNKANAEEKIAKSTCGEVKYKKKRMWHWNEHPPEYFPPESAFRGLDIRYVITSDTTPLNKKTVFGRAIFPKGAMHGRHRHMGAEEIIYIISGRGKALSDGKVYDVVSGSIQYVPQGETHGIKNPYDEPLEIVWGYFGAGSLEDSKYEEDPPDKLDF